MYRRRVYPALPRSNEEKADTGAPFGVHTSPKRKPPSPTSSTEDDWEILRIGEPEQEASGGHGRGSPKGQPRSHSQPARLSRKGGSSSPSPSTGAHGSPSQAARAVSPQLAGQSTSEAAEAGAGPGSVEASDGHNPTLTPEAGPKTWDLPAPAPTRLGRLSRAFGYADVLSDGVQDEVRAGGGVAGGDGLLDGAGVGRDTAGGHVDVAKAQHSPKSPVPSPSRGTVDGGLGQPPLDWTGHVLPTGAQAEGVGDNDEHVSSTATAHTPNASAPEALGSPAARVRAALAAFEAQEAEQTRQQAEAGSEAQAQRQTGQDKAKDRSSGSSSIKPGVATALEACGALVHGARLAVDKHLREAGHAIAHSAGTTVATINKAAQQAKDSAGEGLAQASAAVATAAAAVQLGLVQPVAELGTRALDSGRLVIDSGRIAIEDTLEDVKDKTRRSKKALRDRMQALQEATLPSRDATSSWLVANGPSILAGLAAGFLVVLVARQVYVLYRCGRTGGIKVARGSTAAAAMQSAAAGAGIAAMATDSTATGTDLAGTTTITTTPASAPGLVSEAAPAAGPGVGVPDGRRAKWLWHWRWREGWDQVSALVTGRPQAPLVSHPDARAVTVNAVDGGTVVTMVDIVTTAPPATTAVVASTASGVPDLGPIRSAIDSTGIRQQTAEVASGITVPIGGVALIQHGAASTGQASSLSQAITTSSVTTPEPSAAVPPLTPPQVLKDFMANAHKDNGAGAALDGAAALDGSAVSGDASAGHPKGVIQVLASAVTGVTTAVADATCTVADAVAQGSHKAAKATAGAVKAVFNATGSSLTKAAEIEAGVASVEKPAASSVTVSASQALVDAAPVISGARPATVDIPHPSTSVSSIHIETLRDALDAHTKAHASTKGTFISGGGGATSSGSPGTDLAAAVSNPAPVAPAVPVIVADEDDVEARTALGAYIIRRFIQGRPQAQSGATSAAVAQTAAEVVSTTPGPTLAVTAPPAPPAPPAVPKPVTTLQPATGGAMLVPEIGVPVTVTSGSGSSGSGNSGGSGSTGPETGESRYAALLRALWPGSTGKPEANSCPLESSGLAICPLTDGVDVVGMPDVVGTGPVVTGHTIDSTAATGTAAAISPSPGAPTKPSPVGPRASLASKLSTWASVCTPRTVSTSPCTVGEASVNAAASAAPVDLSTTTSNAAGVASTSTTLDNSTAVTTAPKGTGTITAGSMDGHLGPMKVGYLKDGAFVTPHATAPACTLPVVPSSSSSMRMGTGAQVVPNTIGLAPADVAALAVSDTSGNGLGSTSSTGTGTGPGTAAVTSAGQVTPSERSWLSRLVSSVSALDGSRSTLAGTAASDVAEETAQEVLASAAGTDATTAAGVAGEAAGPAATEALGSAASSAADGQQPTAVEASRMAWIESMRYALWPR